jgi:hypothetical protein
MCRPQQALLLCAKEKLHAEPESLNFYKAQESIAPAYIAWRAGTTTLFLLASYFLAPIDCLKNPAQEWFQTTRDDRKPSCSLCSSYTSVPLCDRLLWHWTTQWMASFFLPKHGETRRRKPSQRSSLSISNGHQLWNWGCNFWFPHYFFFTAATRSKWRALLWSPHVSLSMMLSTSLPHCKSLQFV